MRAGTRHCTEGGFSLMELVVVMAILGIVGTMLSDFLANTMNISARAESSSQTENSGRIALRAVSEDLRSAVEIHTPSSTTSCVTGLTYPSAFAYCVAFLIPHEMFASASTTTIAANAAAVSCPYSSLTYGLVSGSLKEDRTDYDASCHATKTVLGRTVLSAIDNNTDGSQPVFVWYDRYGNRLGSSNSVSDYSNAGSVTIQLYLKYQSGAPDISLVDSAAVRNNR